MPIIDLEIIRDSTDITRFVQLWPASNIQVYVQSLGVVVATRSGDDLERDCQGAQLSP